MQKAQRYQVDLTFLNRVHNGSFCHHDEGGMTKKMPKRV